MSSTKITTTFGRSAARMDAERMNVVMITRNSVNGMTSFNMVSPKDLLIVVFRFTKVNAGRNFREAKGNYLHLTA
jgi:hypothetical protein